MFGPNLLKHQLGSDFAGRFRCTIPYPQFLLLPYVSINFGSEKFSPIYILYNQTLY